MMDIDHFKKLIRVALPFTKVLADKKLCGELAKLDSYEEIYEFLLGVKDTRYTKKDVSDFFGLLVKNFEENKDEIFASINDENVSKVKLSDDEIDSVSGGSLKNWKSKITAATLAALAATTPIFGSGAFATGEAKNSVAQSTNTKSAAKTNRKDSNDPTGKNADTPQKPSRLRQFWEDYGKTAVKITVGIAAIFGVGWLMQKGGQALANSAAAEEVMKTAKNSVASSVHAELLTKAGISEGDKEVDQKLKKFLSDHDKAVVALREIAEAERKKIAGSQTNKSEDSPLLRDVANLGNIFSKERSITGSWGDFFQKAFFPFVSAITLWKTFNGGLEDINKAMNNFGSLDYSLGSTKRTLSKFVNWAEKQAEEPPLKLADIAANLNELYAYGQGNAVRIFRNHLLDWAIKKDISENTGEPFSHGMIMNLYGPSGVGKSFLAQQAADALRMKCLTVSSSIVDKESNVSVIEQLFGTNRYRNPYGGESQEDPTIVEFVKSNPGSMIIIDEYDKIWTKQLDEVLRNIHDYGVVTIRNQKIDFSGTIIVLTSNEKGPEKILKPGAKKDETIKADTISRTDNDFQTEEGFDTTGSITNLVTHDKSFSNRVRWVPFVNLKAAQYVPILQDHLDIGVNAYWELASGAKVEISDSVIQQMSRFVELQNEGARPIDQQIIPDINQAILKVAKKMGLDNPEKNKDKAIVVSFNERTGKASASISSKGS